MKNYKYVVYGKLDNEIEHWCEKHNIEHSVDGNRIAFVGTDNSLKDLHNEFFNEYEFELE